MGLLPNYSQPKSVLVVYEKDEQQQQLKPYILVHFQKHGDRGSDDDLGVHIKHAPRQLLHHFQCTHHAQKRLSTLL